MRRTWRDWDTGSGGPLESRDAASAEPLEGPPDQSEMIRDVGVILAIVLGAAVLANLLLMLSGG